MQQAKESIELLDFVFDLGDATRKALADKKVTLGDMPLFINAAFKAPSGLGGIEKVPRELKEMDPVARQEVLDFVQERFDLPNDQLEELVEETLREVYDLGILLQKWQKYRRGRRA